MIKKWNTVSKEKIADLLIFEAFKLRRTHPISKQDGTFTVIHSNDWANIIPVTKDGDIIMVEQYRHGTDSITLELPGGLVENGEHPKDAAVRELLEETGYSSKEAPIFLGSQAPNPAFLNNKCDTYLLEGCELQDEQNLDTNEIIDIHLLKKELVKEMIKSGKINHSIILTAFYFYSLYCEF